MVMVTVVVVLVVMMVVMISYVSGEVNFRLTAPRQRDIYEIALYDL
jgi:hypothetical protein